MKTKIFNFVVICSSILILFLIFLNKTIVFDSVSFGINIWIKNVFPSLFPFFIISDILIKYNITSYIPSWIKKIFRYLFNVSDNVITIFFLSMVSGFPSNARNTRIMYDNNMISVDEANYVLMFTHFSNPFFILGTVSVFFLKNETYGIIILVSHYLSNFIIGILFRNKKYYSHINYTNVNNKCQNFSSVFVNAISSSINSLIMILGTLISFLVISSLIIDLFKFNLYSDAIVKGILEITMGLKSLSLLNIDDIYKVVISTMFLSFGGFSVHMQVISNIIDTDIKYFYFFFGRVIHVMLSFVLSLLLFLIFF